MRIGLIAVDSNYPNLALMKISGWHKAVGDTVEWYNPFDDYDMVYMSKIFSFTPDYEQYITNTKHIRKGGPAMTFIPDCPKKWNLSCRTILSIRLLTIRPLTAFSPVVVPTSASGA